MNSERHSVCSKTLGMLAVLAAGSAAALAETGKDQYTLWNPTPRELMRGLTTDRPDVTESPYTVDAGHFQVEADLIRYGFDRYNEARADEAVENWSVSTANLKVGLCNRADFQLLVPTYNWTRVKTGSPGVVQRDEGFGDMVARVKINAWGNDDGRTALAVMPYIKLPTASGDLGNGDVEGGIIVPFAADLAYGWGMGVMTELDVIRDSSGGGYHPEFLNTVSFGHDLIGKLAGYVEFISVVSTESGSDWVGLIGAGLTYAVNDDLQLDGGVNVGVTRSADDISPFVGVSWRF